RSIVDDGRRNHLSRLIQRQAGQRAHHAAGIFALEVDAYRLTGADALNHLANQLAQFLVVRELQLEANSERVEVRRQLDRISGEHDRRARGRQLVSEIAEGSGDVRVGQVRREVLEEKDRVEIESLDVAQGLE